MHFTHEARGAAVGHFLLDRDLLEIDEAIPDRLAIDDPEARVCVFCSWEVL
ncbi:hypothetical protein Q1M63_24030 [Sinorhizobium meliloti]|nr:hypothetical protein Q1M63_24030 [Sinorhizobium meliloti]